MSPIGPTARQTLGLREISGVIAGAMTKEQAQAAIEQATRQYAKRQLTWFRRESHLEFVELQGDDIPEGLVEKWARQAAAPLG
jgi:tRNA dimethylallyltransferase